MKSLLGEAGGGLRARRGRALLSAAGIALAAAMLSTAAAVGYGLRTGFDRSAHAADLPDVIARFTDERSSRIAPRIRALPNLAAYEFRFEATNVGLAGGGHRSRSGVVEVLGSGRRGYALVAGRDVSARPGDVVVEQGVARAWNLRIGDSVDVGGLRQRVVGISQAPDNVAYPLAAPRVYLSRAALDARFGAEPDPRVNQVELWVRNRNHLDQTLVQARATSYGIHDLRFVTRAGVQVLLDQAAGIVIALLIALSVIALATAGVMLAASARAEIQRRLTSIGVRRALGATRGRIATVQALEALMVAIPAATAGVLAGSLISAAPSDHLLAILNEQSPGGALALPLGLSWVVAVMIPVLAAAWPAWKAAARPPVSLLRGAELRSAVGHRPRFTGGIAGLGGRLVVVRRTRLAATLAVLGVSAGFVLLMLALASELNVLENDPGALGKRYQLAASLPASQASQVRGLPGVVAAAPRYEVQALDSFALGETIDVIAYPSDHTVFEDPPLASGRRLRGRFETEVGTGLAQVLGLGVGSTLALQLPSGPELRFRVAGVDSSLDHDGRVAFVSAAALLAAAPATHEQIAIRLAPGASPGAVSQRLTRLGAISAPTPTATGKGQTLIGALAAILRAVAAVDGLVCLYTLVQALALTAQERRGTIAVLRACGGGRGSVRALLAGAAVAVVVPAAAVGVLLERFLLGPAMARLAAGYASLSLSVGGLEICVVILGLFVLATGAVGWVAHQASRESIVTGLAG